MSSASGPSTSETYTTPSCATTPGGSSSLGNETFGNFALSSLTSPSRVNGLVVGSTVEREQPSVTSTSRQEPKSAGLTGMAVSLLHRAHDELSKSPQRRIVVGSIVPRELDLDREAWRRRFQHSE